MTILIILAALVLTLIFYQWRKKAWEIKIVERRLEELEEKNKWSE